MVNTKIKTEQLWLQGVNVADCPAPERYKFASMREYISTELGPLRNRYRQKGKEF